MANGSVNGDAVFELCTRLSLKEFGSVLNFLQTASILQSATERTRLFHLHRHLFSPSEIWFTPYISHSATREAIMTIILCFLMQDRSATVVVGRGKAASQRSCSP